MVEASHSLATVDVLGQLFELNLLGHSLLNSLLFPLSAFCL